MPSTSQRTAAAYDVAVSGQRGPPVFMLEFT
jgi:hypothetical protein